MERRRRRAGALTVFIAGTTLAGACTSDDSDGSLRDAVEAGTPNGTGGTVEAGTSEEASTDVETGTPHEASIAPDAALLSSCTLEMVISHILTGSEGLFCGILPIGASADAVRVANDCVSTAYAAKQAFRLSIEEQGIDSQVSRHYLGVEVDGHYVVIEVFYDSYGYLFYGLEGELRDANIISRPCTSFSVTPSCDIPDGSLFTDPCVTCTHDGSAVCACLNDTSTLVCPAQPAE